MQTGFTYRNYFEREMQMRTARNAKYSLRAFARDIGIAAPKLSQILSGNCGLSKQAAERVSECLNLTQEETQYFVALVELEHSRSKSGKLRAREKIADIDSSRMHELDLERFRIIADWYHFSILELTEVTHFKSDLNWIAKTLGISKEQAKLAIQRLLDHGLLTEGANGTLKQTHAHLSTPSGIPSRELKNHHSQILKKADEALYSIPVTERDISANTFAIDSSQMEEARKALQEFRRKFCKNLQTKNPKDRVYCLAIQMFPLDLQPIKTIKNEKEKI